MPSSTSGSAFRQSEPGGCDTFDIVGIEWRKPPVTPLLARDELVEEPVDVLFTEREALSESLVRWRGIVRGRARIEQKLQGQSDARVTCFDCAVRRERSAGTVACDGQHRAFTAVARKPFRDPPQRIRSIVESRRKFVLRG